MLTMHSPAKINLFLEIIEKRNDGFHNIESIFQTIPLFDTLSLEPAEEELSLAANVATLPTDMNNLVLRAACLLKQECGVKEGGHFSLTKNIPDTGGLGGGSSNAASALILANKLWNLGLSQRELAEFAARIGSDVAFFIYGGTCLCEGRGEIVTPLADTTPLPISVIAPPWGISTPVAFSHLDKSRFNKMRVSTFIDILKTRPQNLNNIYQASFNHFEETVFQIEPRQKNLHTILRDNQIQARMSGSGSCVWIPGRDITELPAIIPDGCKIIL